MNIFDELKRRNVIRVGIAYAIFGWVIAQVADLALESFGAPDWVMKTLLFLMLIGFLVSLFIAWAYEMTPEGIKRDEDVDPDTSITQHTGRKLDRLVIIVLVLAVATLLAERYLHKGEPEAQAENQLVESVAPIDVEANKEKELSVAVLPFVNISSDPEQEFFSDGISEEILNVLTRIPNLKVAARTSSFQFKGQNLDIAKIGEQLKVNHILEGSVRKAGKTLRITAQLIEAETGFHLWSDTFDRQLEDVFAIQDEIAGAIAGELRMRLVNLPERASTPVNMDAYELYLKGRGLVARRKAANLLTAMDILKSAIEIEPQYAQAMATLAKAYAVFPWFSYEIPAGEARETARQWTEKALLIEPDNVEALAVLAIVYSESDMNFPAARELLERAVKLNPGSVAAHNFLGDLCIRTGDLDCALVHESRAAELDPLGPIQLTDLANVYLIRGQYDKTIQLAEQALTLDSSFAHAYRHLFNASFMKGNDKQMANHLQESSRLSVFPEGAMHSFQFQYDFISGNREIALKDLSQRAGLAAVGEISAVDVAYDAAAIGDYDTAGNMLLKAYESKDGTWLFPVFIRLPEQAPDSAPWQKFWSQPGVAELAELRRKNGLKPFPEGFISNQNP
jgi:TolB-like protein